jgi:uncharacterized membrane protein
VHALIAQLRRHPYRFGACGLLAAASLFCLLLVRWRYADQPDTYSTYAFLIQNLLLAWIPLVIAIVAEGIILPRKLSYVVLPVLVILWLLFFPNAPYLLTDFQHLRLYSDDPKLWFDVIMVIWFVFTGFLVGLVSLYLMHRLVRHHFGRISGWAFVVVASMLSGAGIFAGKFLRLRSWEVFLYPQQYLHRLTQNRAQIADPVAYIALYASFIVFVYVVLYLFSSVFRQDAERS